MSPETIVKCFKNSGVYDFDASPPCSPESIISQEKGDSDTKFAEYFVNLLGVPWYEYLQMDDYLEAKNPSCAPDANTCTENIQDLPDQDQDQRNMEAMTTTEAKICLRQ